MKQILQDLRNGETLLAEVPSPTNLNGNLLIRTSKTVVSAGTERMLVNFGKANYLEKARQQPDKVKMVLNKIKTDGLFPTLEAVNSKLDDPLPLGYCNCGVVEESGSAEFKKGDRVISNGSHAEMVRVPTNLCAKIPDNVDDESAAFTVIASIALQGIRLLKPTLGEYIVVSGLGLIGLIAVQILKANGCKVLGIDFDENRCKIAQSFGIETINLSKTSDPLSDTKIFSKGQGIDGVLITASTDSNDPISQAANMLRKRGKIVLVGVVGMKLSREEFYDKEISFQVSCSYGPGRYDHEYEEKGNDYPIGYVRWTEQRNFQAILQMMSDGDLDLKPLISKRFHFDSAIEAYSQLNNKDSLGILLDYKNESLDVSNKSIQLNKKIAHKKENLVICGFLGAGNYSSRVLIPTFKKYGAILDTVVTSKGINSSIQGKKHGFALASTDESEIFNSKEINTVVIATQHYLHASQVINSLKSGKNVFVEKPLAITMEELEKIKTTYNEIKGPKPKLMVGFNRRFSPQIKKLKKLLDSKSSPKSYIYTVNAGSIPSNHWTQRADLGGGRIIGECCHFLDLLLFLATSKISAFSAHKIKSTDPSSDMQDTVSVTLLFENGSMGTIHYFSDGGKNFPKERLEVFCDDAVLQLDNFKNMKGFGWKGFSNYNLFSQDKGQKNCINSFIESLTAGDENLIEFEDLYNISKLSIEIEKNLRYHKSES